MAYMGASKGNGRGAHFKNHIQAELWEEEDKRTPNRWHLLYVTCFIPYQPLYGCTFAEATEKVTRQWLSFLCTRAWAMEAVVNEAAGVMEQLASSLETPQNTKENISSKTVTA
eukprot:2560091-Amphidinium_carterae.1